MDSYNTAVFRKLATVLYRGYLYFFAQNPPKSSHFFQSKIHRLCHGLQDIPWLSSLLRLWSYFVADLPSLSLCHVLLPQGLCTFAGSSAWPVHVLLLFFIQVSIQRSSSEMPFLTTPKHPHSLITFSLAYGLFSSLTRMETTKNRDFVPFIHHCTSGPRVV